MITTSPEQRQAVVAEAHTWVGTPYHAHARVKGAGGGVDCVHLLCAVYEVAGLLPPIDPGFYSVQWHLNHSDELYLQGLGGRGLVITDAPQPGDMALFRFGRTMSHTAVFVEPNLLVHAFNPKGARGRVEYVRLTEKPLVGREALFFNIDNLG